MSPTNACNLPLTKGFHALVSECDFESLSSVKWCAIIRGQLPYAVRFVGPKLLSMHRVIMEAPVGFHVDHINNNTLDNRRENLRVCSQAENLRNRRSLRGASQYKGVSPSRNKWRADIRFNGNGRYVGTFLTEIEAAKAYDAAAIEVYGDFASLNFPGNGKEGGDPTTKEDAGDHGYADIPRAVRLDSPPQFHPSVQQQ